MWNFKFDSTKWESIHFKSVTFIPLVAKVWYAISYEGPKIDSSQETLYQTQNKKATDFMYT